MYEANQNACFSFSVKLFLKLVLKPFKFGVEVRGVFQEDAVFYAAMAMT